MKRIPSWNNRNILDWIILVLMVVSFCNGHSQSLSECKTWSYHLQAISPSEIQKSKYDLVVIDRTADGSEQTAFTRSEVRHMKTKPDSSSRLVIAYMSIGEAEDYRYYWKYNFTRNKPAWLDKENPQWQGNYKVFYWDKEWQKIIFGTPESYLDKIIAEGYDGVYLDIIDAFEYYENSVPDAAAKMTEFISSLSAYAKTRAGKNFFIIGQNGETLVDQTAYLNAIDGVAKEELYYGIEKTGKENDSEEIEYSLKHLRKARDNGKTVFLVEYINEFCSLQEVIEKSTKEQFVPFFANRELNSLEGTFITADSSQVKPKGVTPGRFYSVVLPKGYFRIISGFEYYKEELKYYRTVNQNTDREFTARDFFQSGFSASAFAGLGNNWQVGITLPLIYSHLYSDTYDSLLYPETPINYTGPGNLQLYLDYGKSWNDYKDNILLEVMTGLPTDLRSSFFHPGSFGRVAVTREHYWKRTGIIGVAALNYYSDEAYSYFEINPEVDVGVGVMINQKLYFNIMAVQEKYSTTIDLFMEYLLGRKSSLEFFAGKGIVNTNKMFYTGISFNWLGWKNR